MPQILHKNQQVNYTVISLSISLHTYYLRNKTTCQNEYCFIFLAHYVLIFEFNNPLSNSYSYLEKKNIIQFKCIRILIKKKIHILQFCTQYCTHLTSLLILVHLELFFKFTIYFSFVVNSGLHLIST